jgi:ABC-type sugar transport system substrate-binding protein
VAEAGGGAGGPSSHRGRRVNGAVVAEISVEVRVPICQRAVRRGAPVSFTPIELVREGAAGGPTTGGNGGTVAAVGG